MKLYRSTPRAAAAYAGVVGRKSYTKGASIPTPVSLRMNGYRPRGVRELADELLTRGGSSHWFED